MKLKRIEIVLLSSLLLTLLFTTTLTQTRDGLAEKLIRLHVVANSDSETDQALKLQVRDAVLAALEKPLSNAESLDDGIRIVNENIQNALDTANYMIESAGYTYDVSVALTRETFPTREYETFTLPAGEYVTLRVVIGDGAGRNWWCVIYPQLCSGAVTEEIANEFLNPEEVKLIAGGDTNETSIRFRLLEIVAKVREFLKSEE